MKQLPSVAIGNFKEGMYSSDASELRGKAILLENVIYDEELGKAIKVKDYDLTYLRNWLESYFLSDTDPETSEAIVIEDMVFYSPEENLEYLVIAVNNGSAIRIYFFEIGSDFSLTYHSSKALEILESVLWLRLNVAGKVLRISYENAANVKFVKWYGDLGNKEMIFVEGIPQMRYSGFALEDARPLTSGIYLGDYGFGGTDIELDIAGREPGATDFDASIEYYKSYKISIQVDDSQESEYADLLIATAKTAQAVTFDIKLVNGFPKRLSKIHIWRRVSADPIEYSDSHELIKTLDVARNNESSVFQDNMTTIANVSFAVDYKQNLANGDSSNLIYQRVIVNNIPDFIFTIRSYNFSIFLN